MPKLTLFVVLLLGVFVLGFMFWEARQLKMRRQDLFLPDWPSGFDGVRFLWITDIHRRSIPTMIRKQLAQEKIDLVLIGGDIVEKNIPMDRVQETIRFLSSLAPNYFVWGNHDYQADTRLLDTMLREEGVRVLDNSAVSFEAGTDRLWLVGVDDYLVKRDNLTQALADIDQDGYRLLLSHNPSIVKKLKEEHRIQGVFSGHTHGGQICLPFLGPLTAIRREPFLAGEYTLAKGNYNLKVFVSKGVGTSRLPLRLRAMPELHLFTMRSSLAGTKE